jgi:hypothetical protein
VNTKLQSRRVGIGNIDIDITVVVVVAERNSGAVQTRIRKSGQCGDIIELN